MKGIVIGKIFGIPIRLHWSWFIIFILVAWSLAAGYFPFEYPNLSTTTYWIIAALTSLLFAGSVLAHELGHAYAAQRIPIAVREVLLYIFGGIADIQSEPGTPRQEFQLAVIGPLVNLLLGGIFWVIWFSLKHFTIIAAPTLWLARMNLLLAGFNLIPGFPLDGGRILRAVLWKITRNPYRATRIATLSGKVIALILTGAGIFVLFVGNVFTGLWLALMGWFLQNAANSYQFQSTIIYALKGVMVRQVMFSNLPSVPWHIHLDRFIEEYVPDAKADLFMVTDNTGEYLRGILPLRRLATVPRHQWAQIIVQDVMIPRRNLTSVHPDQSLTEALRIMEDTRVIHAPVMENEHILGILTKEEILNYAKLRTDIGF
jgi:Zn-dependent protease